MNYYSLTGDAAETNDQIKPKTFHSTMTENKKLITQVISHLFIEKLTYPNC